MVITLELMLPLVMINYWKTEYVCLKSSNSVKNMLY